MFGRRDSRLLYEQGSLVFSAGADRLYALRDVAEEAAQELIGHALGDGELSPQARDLLDRVTAGALLDPPQDPEPRRVALRWAGDRNVALEGRLRAFVDESPWLFAEAREADLLLVVRTNAPLTDIYDSPAALREPHLLLDLAYHHTISLGPLVLAEETACLACLAGRIGHTWGDPEPPPEPRALEAANLAAALAAHELERVALGDLTLVNATVTHDLERREATKAAVYRLPWCPICGDGGATPGRIELPWAA